jgi:hypothetical protein
MGPTAFKANPAHIRPTFQRLEAQSLEIGCSAPRLMMNKSFIPSWTTAD